MVGTLYPGALDILLQLRYIFSFVSRYFGYPTSGKVYTYFISRFNIYLREANVFLTLYPGA